MNAPTPAQRGWWFSNNEATQPDYDPTDAERGGLAAAWAESRAAARKLAEHGLAAGQEGSA